MSGETTFPIGSDPTIRHIPKFTGEIWYVDGVSGSDANNGQVPDQGFLTIGMAITTCAAGDALQISAATYTEDNLDINKNAVELWAEIGAA